MSERRILRQLEAEHDASLQRTPNRFGKCTKARWIETNIQARVLNALLTNSPQRHQTIEPRIRHMIERWWVRARTWGGNRLPIGREARRVARALPLLPNDLQPRAVTAFWKAL